MQPRVESKSLFFTGEARKSPEGEQSDSPGNTSEAYH